jgi:hypothetical protein
MDKTSPGTYTHANPSSVLVSRVSFVFQKQWYVPPSLCVVVDSSFSFFLLPFWFRYRLGMRRHAVTSFNLSGHVKSFPVSYVPTKRIVSPFVHLLKYPYLLLVFDSEVSLMGSPDFYIEYLKDCFNYTFNRIDLRGRLERSVASLDW